MTAEILPDLDLDEELDILEDAKLEREELLEGGVDLRDDQKAVLNGLERVAMEEEQLIGSLPNLRTDQKEVGSNSTHATNGKESQRGRLPSKDNTKRH
jgi:hypothetical protein